MRRMLPLASRDSAAVMLAFATLLGTATVSWGAEEALPLRDVLLDLRLASISLPAELPEQCELSAMLGDQPVALRLHRRSARSPSCQLLVDHGDGALIPAALPPSRSYRGVVVGEPGSAVSATLAHDGLLALVARADGELWQIEPTARLSPGAAPGSHVAYRLKDVIPTDVRCGNELVELIREDPEEPLRVSYARQRRDERSPSRPLDPVGPDEPEGGLAGATKYLAEVAFDADFEFFQKHSSSLALTIEDIEAVMSQVDFVYDRDVDINYEFTTFVVRTASNDPYTSFDPMGLLCEFRSTWNSPPESAIQREVAHLFSGKSLLGAAGIAYPGVVCNETGLSCGSQSGDLAYSVAAWPYLAMPFTLRVALSCHELGHNWGATHCDAAGDGNCFIMCSLLGGCGGTAGGNLKFGPPAISEIVSFRNSANCDLPLPVSLSIPFLEPWAGPTISTNTWVYSKGAQSSTGGTNEPSVPRSLQLNAAGGGPYDGDELRSHTFELGSVPQDLVLSYWTQHKGVERGETLIVDYFSDSDTWVTLGTIVSNGTSQSTFAQWAHLLPADSKHDGFRIRFRTGVDEANDDWYIDDIRIEFAPAPPNDNCSGAGLLVLGLNPFSTANATTSTPAAPDSCNDGNGTTLVNDVWFKHTVACSGTLTISTCGLTALDTRLLIYPGPQCPMAGTAPLGCDDDSAGCTAGTSTITLEVSSGQQLVVRLGALSGYGSGEILLECELACPDLDGDGVVGGADLGAMLGAWGACVSCGADLSGDGVVDGSDLGLLLGSWGPCE